MTSPTLDRGLRAYDVAGKLRALRLRKKMRLVELAKHTGLSAAMLSKLERGQLFPDAANAATDRAGIRGRPRPFLRRIGPAQIGRDRPAARADAIRGSGSAPPPPRGNSSVGFRGHRAAAQCLPVDLP